MLGKVTHHVNVLHATELHALKNGLDGELCYFFIIILQTFNQMHFNKT